MKAALRFLCIFAMLVAGTVLSSFLKDNNPGKTHFSFPYKQAGLTDRQAAAHLLSRFTYGATPGEIDQVVSMGLEQWFRQQLDAGLPDDSLNQLLSGYDALKLSNTEIINTYPKPGTVLRMAVKDGVIDKDSAKTDRKEYREKLAAYMLQKGYKPEQELFRQFINQKILRATYTNNQLQEVMTDFWLNHFNVSLTKNDCSPFIPNYERDVIRPNSLNKFENLLLATAKSPAMLYYLDNFSSAGVNTDFNQQANGPFQKRFAAQIAANAAQQGLDMQKLQQAKKNQGLNENYAREVMELHTLGVDGGYTQQDVTQAAKILTGWTIYPMDENGYGGAAMRKIIERVGMDRLEEKGFVHEGDFLFAVNRHDNSDKTVLGKYFPAHGGYYEGVTLLELLAHHPSTAKFISRKLAVRFVNDNPPQSLIDKMAQTFTAKNGDIKELLITMVSSPEFWSKEALREKTKSPFELVISSMRGLDATIKQPYQLYTWINRMGQPIYHYQAPTGFPDKGQYWINTGALLNRMNFGLALASGRIPGVSFNLAALNNHHEPESPEAALITYSKILMPERNLDETIKRLTPFLNDPTLMDKVNDAAAKATPPEQPTMTGSDDNMMMEDAAGKGKGVKDKNLPKRSFARNDYMAVAMNNNNPMLSQVVGIIVGSPEFQRK